MTILLPLLALAAAPAAPAANALPDCTASQLSLGFDGENGAFDGMSHSGTLLVLRNLSPTACRIAGLPTLVLKGKDGKPLPIMRNIPIGMHPGPVIVPVAVPSGAEATAALRWVTGPVYPESRCYDVAYATVAIGAGTQQSALAAHICGPAGGKAGFDQPVLRTDPTL